MSQILPGRARTGKRSLKRGWAGERVERGDAKSKSNSRNTKTWKRLKRLNHKGAKAREELVQVRRESSALKWKALGTNLSLRCKKRTQIRRISDP